MRLPAVRGPLHAAGRKGGAGASSESRFMEILSHRQVSDNSGECFVSGMKLLRRHLAPSSPSPALSSVASLGCFTPTRTASRPGRRHHRGGIRVPVCIVMRQLDLRQMVWAGPVGVVCG